jgi:nitroreductase
MEDIFVRRSIRKFKDQPVEPEKIDKLLRAAMQAPSAVDEEPWEFIVVQDKERLKALSKVGPYKKPVAGSAVTFVLLANEHELKIPRAWEHDLGAAAENLLLEAVHLGLGGVWLGVATSEATMKNVSELFKLPENIKPFAFVSVGYPDGQENKFVDRYKADRVHYESWS